MQLHDVVDSDDDGVTAVIPVRVLDDATDAPVAEAIIDNWTEAGEPHAEPWEDLHWGSWTTDRDGFAIVPSLDRAAWWFVEAPGYGPRAEMGFEDVRRIHRGVDFPIEVRDWRDRPVPGAVVEALLGCGHTPTVRISTAGPDGRLVFSCIDPSFETDLWVRTPGLAGRNDAYWGGGPEELPVEGGIHVLRCDPSAVIEGRVLRPDGSPAGGAVVGTTAAHRGPWTRADADGRFRLVGAPMYGTITAAAPYSDPAPDGFLRPQTEFQSVPGVFVTVTLPAEGKREQTPEEREAERERWRAERDAQEAREAEGIEEPDPPVPLEGPGVRVRVTTADAAARRGYVRIVLVRQGGDGTAAVEYARFRDGAAARSIVVGPGRWTVTAGDPARWFRPAARTVDVGTGWTDVEFVLTPNPTWKPRWVERAPGGKERALAAPPEGKLYVVTDDDEVAATPGLDAAGEPDGSIHVPAEGPFAVRFRSDHEGWRTHVVFDGFSRRDAGPALVAPAPEATPPDESDDDAEPPRDFPPARLTVLLPDGRPAAGVGVAILTPPRLAGPPPRLVPEDSRYVELDDAGTAETGFDRAERIVVESEGGDGARILLPLTARIEHPGPWTLRWPSTEVVVSAKDESGVPLHEFTVSLGGWDAIDAVDGAVKILGADSGPLRLWVGAPGRIVRDIRLVLTAGEKREVVARMRPAVRKAAAEKE